MAYKEKICGVYRLFCINSNRAYIGSSKDIKGRFTWHRFILRHNSPQIGYGLTRVHPCQEDWNIFGEKSFKFEILEVCGVNERISIEQHYMDLPEYVDRYNFDVQANGKCIRSKETRQLQSEIAKERNMRSAYNNMLSERAKRQHKEGNFGVCTWKTR